jgi:hypothetical protein
LLGRGTFIAQPYSAVLLEDAVMHTRWLMLEIAGDDSIACPPAGICHGSDAIALIDGLMTRRTERVRILNRPITLRSLCRGDRPVHGSADAKDEQTPTTISPQTGGSRAQHGIQHIPKFAERAGRSPASSLPHAANLHGAVAVDARESCLRAVR